MNFINPLNANYINPLIENTFKQLNIKYGFDKPTFHTVVYEFYVEYIKDKNIVSVYFDPWTLPFVELFRPERKIEFRNIPLIRTIADKQYLLSYLHLASKMNDKSIEKMLTYDIQKVKDEYEKYLEEYWLIFEEQEKQFLLGNECNYNKCV